MGRRPKVAPEIKIEYVERILAGKTLIKATVRKNCRTGAQGNPCLKLIL